MARELGNKNTQRGSHQDAAQQESLPFGTSVTESAAMVSFETSQAIENTDEFDNLHGPDLPVSDSRKFVSSGSLQSFGLRELLDQKGVLAVRQEEVSLDLDSLRATSEVLYSNENCLVEASRGRQLSDLLHIKAAAELELNNRVLLVSADDRTTDLAREAESTVVSSRIREVPSSQEVEGGPLFDRFIPATNGSPTYDIGSASDIAARSGSIDNFLKNYDVVLFEGFEGRGSEQKDLDRIYKAATKSQDLQTVMVSYVETKSLDSLPAHAPGFQRVIQVLGEAKAFDEEYIQVRLDDPTYQEDSLLKDAVGMLSDCISSASTYAERILLNELRERLVREGRESFLKASVGVFEQGLLPTRKAEVTSEHRAKQSLTRDNQDFVDVVVKLGKEFGIDAKLVDRDYEDKPKAGPQEIRWSDRFERNFPDLYQEVVNSPSSFFLEGRTLEGQRNWRNLYSDICFGELNSSKISNHPKERAIIQLANELIKTGGVGYVRCESSELSTGLVSRLGYALDIPVVNLDSMNKRSLWPSAPTASLKDIGDGPALVVGTSFQDPGAIVLKPEWIFQHSVPGHNLEFGSAQVDARREACELEQVALGNPPLIHAVEYNYGERNDFWISRIKISTKT